MAIRALCFIANPSDLSRFDAEQVWKEMLDCLRPWTDRDVIVLARATVASESELRNAASQEWSVLHFVGYAQARAAAYGTITLLASDGRARNVTASAFANAISDLSFRVVVLEACDEVSFRFDGLADAIAERGLAVVLLPCLRGTQRCELLTKLYGGLSDGLPGEILWQRLAATAGTVRVIAGFPAYPLIKGGEAQIGTSAQAAMHSGPVGLRSWTAPRKEVSVVLDEKRIAGTFDVFVSYHTADRCAVKVIAERLKQDGILPWFDAWEMTPGRDWQELVEDQISKARSAAVFFGASGRGPWQDREARALLEQFVQRKTPVIPVLLPNAPSTPNLPLFLRTLTWVDFRSADPDPYVQLIWGITGQRPKN